MISATKTCCRCAKDVSEGKRVKDARGQYYCEACHAQAKAEQTPAKSSPTKPSTVRSAPPAPVSAKKAPAPLPDFCPNCDAPVLPNRRLCIKCHRDVTQMDKLIAMKAEAAKPKSEERIASVIGMIMKVVGIAVVLGIFAFIGIGLWMLFHPPAAFDEYPKTREAAVRGFLGDIAEGTDQSYEKAFLLVSFRERTTNNPQEIDNYKRLFAKINDEFKQKYGDDWISKIKLENPDPADIGETTVFNLELGQDEYHVLPSVQISVQQGVLNRTIRRDVPTYPENEKNHFGVIGIAEYPVHPKRRIDEQAGPGRPEQLPFPIPLNQH